jgi:hypothetical protein
VTISFAQPARRTKQTEEIDMPELIPQATIIGAKPYTAAEVDHQRWLQRVPHPASAEPPQVKFYGEIQSFAEMEVERLGRLRPASGASGDIRAALTAVAAEMVLATARFEGINDQIGRMMTSGTAADIMAARGRLELAEIELQRLAHLEAEMRPALIRAEAAEASRQAALDALVPDARKTVAAFRKAVETEFPKLAARIAELVEMERECEAALHTIRTAGYPASLPLTPGGHSLRTSVTILGYVERPRAPVNEGSVYGH